jgi:WD40 repeat protein/tRNA A-37 threonylcarbamoyl transferase component Bud32
MNEPSREKQLESILHAYLQAVDAGGMPDQGEVLRRHPDLADELREFFADAGKMDRFAQSLRKAQIGDATIGADGASDTEGALPRLRYFGDYELLEEIARGGMGVVYKARQVSLNRIVALKMILAGQFASTVEVQRFHTEAEAAANLDHPNIVPIYEVGEHEGRHYFSMKLVEGPSLGKVIADCRSQNADIQKAAAQLMAIVARAVHYAHQRGIIHRDLKPANILLSSPHSAISNLQSPIPMVTDFGLAKRMEGDANLSQSGAIVGTPAYMAPEQAAGKKGLTTAADVYSLGAILYELLTGKPPFVGATPMDILLQVMDKEPAPPRQVQPGIDRDLETVVLKCLEKDPARRYSSPSALADDLERWIQDEPIEARPAGKLEKAWKWARRKPAQAALAATVLIATTALLVVGVIFNAYLQVASTEIDNQKAEVKKVQAEADDRLADADKRLDNAKSVQRHMVYVGDLDRAHRVLKENFPMQAGEMLDKYLDSNLRGWEWHYLKRKSQGEMCTMPGQFALAWSPDGKMLATCHGNGIALRDAETGKLLRTLTRPNAETPVTSIAFDKEGKRLAAWQSFRLLAPEGAFFLWDVPAGKLLWEAKEPGIGRPLAVRPDGRQLATAVRSDHNEVHLRDLDTGQITKTLTFPATKDHKHLGWTIHGMAPVRSLAYSPDGKILAMGIVNGYVILWSSETGEQLSQVHLGHYVGALAFDPAEGTLYAGDQGSNISILRAEAKGQWSKVGSVNLGQDNEVSHLAVAPQSGRLLSASKDRVIRLWQVRGSDLQQLAAWSGHETDINALAFSPDGKRFASVDSETQPSQIRDIKIWDVAALDVPAGGSARLGAASIEGWPANLTAKLVDFATSADGKYWAGARYANDQEGVVGHKFETLTEICDAASGKVLWEVTKKVHTWTGVGRMQRVVFSPDSQRLATMDRAWTWPAKPIPSLEVWDIPSRKKVFELDTHAAEHILFSPDGRWLATMGLDGAIHFWHASTGKPAFTHEPSKKYEQSASEWQYGVVLAFTPDSKFLVLGTGLLLEVHADGLKEVGTFAFPEEHAFMAHFFGRKVAGRAECLAISPDGRYLAASSWPGKVDLWDLEKRRLHQRVADCHPRNNRPTNFNSMWLAFSPDGKNLAYATEFGAVHLWNLAAGQDVLVLEEGRLRDMRRARLFFSKDGNKLFGISKSDPFLNPKDSERWDVWNATPLAEDALYARTAKKRIDDLANELGLKEEIQARLEADTERSERLRKAALAQLANFPENPHVLNELATAVTARAGRSAKDYELALRQAKRAVELTPNTYLVHTLGEAYYRVGAYQTALKTLRKAIAMRQEKERKEGFWDLPFLAMIHHRLGQPDEARAYLKSLRDLAKENRGPLDEAQYRAFLAEAEELIEGKK